MRCCSLLFIQNSSELRDLDGFGDLLLRLSLRHGDGQDAVLYLGRNLVFYHIIRQRVALLVVRVAELTAQIVMVLVLMLMLLLVLDGDGEVALVIENKQEHKHEDKHHHYLRREFSYSNYEQSYTLPDDVVRDQISAKVEDGILTVTMPKTEPKQKVTKSIEVS